MQTHSAWIFSKAGKDTPLLCVYLLHLQDQSHEKTLENTQEKSPTIWKSLEKVLRKKLTASSIICPQNSFMSI